MTRIADEFLRVDLMQAWTLMPALDEAAPLVEALCGRGWAVPRGFESLQELIEALKASPARPDIVIARVRLPDGDAFELIRCLAAIAEPPALFLVSRQQRAVIKAAYALCEAHGVDLIGNAAMPLHLEQDLAALDTFRAAGGTRSRRPAPRMAPLPISALHALVDNGGIRAFLQPKMRLSSGRVTGFEALMRGVAADGRIVSPLHLIEPLSNAGLLLPATLQMFDQTVNFLMECLNDGIAVGASVNVPLSLISDHRFCRKLVECVETAGLDPSWITIEITEDEAMSNPALVIENSARIRMFGFNLSIDDFGTAYSSFAHLTKIPFSELKIERTFISGIESDKSKQAVVAACALLGSRLGLDVVAEGVETVTELEAVRAAGCSDIQGYLLSRPVPVPEAAAWLRSLDGERFALAQDAALQSWVPNL